MAVSEQARQQAIEAFEQVATPQERRKVGEVSDAVVSAVTAAQSIQVRTAQEAEDATEFLSRLAREKRQAEDARKFLVGPLNAHVKAINERFKPTAEMLDSADQIVREKVITYRRQVEEARRLEQERLDAERRERERMAEEQRRREEAEARAAREAAAREAARAEADARAAERRRQEELAAKASARRQEIAAMDDDALKLLIDEGDQCGSPADARMASEELEARQRAREAQERAAAAREAEEAARRAEEEARSRPLPEIPATVVAAAPRLASTSGRVAERKRWKATVVSEALVPRQYLKVDEAAINAAVRGGARHIAGVRIEQVDELAVRAR